MIREKSALNIKTGDQLLRFDLGSEVIGNTTYTVLTGWETEKGICFWCGEKLKGKAKRYCYSHMAEYYNHFNWGYASYEAKKRVGWKCENCGKVEGDRQGGWNTLITDLEVHHIIPINGKSRFFSAFNLPWNLIALCHECHMALHAIMREKNRKPIPTNWGLAKQRGQLLMLLDGKTPSASTSPLNEQGKVLGNG